MLPALSLSLATGQTLAVLLSDPAEVNVLAQIASGLLAATATAKVNAEVLARTYHLGSKATAGLDYNDRLAVRMGVGTTKLREQIELWRQYGGKRGGLRHLRFGAKITVTEAAVREFHGDPLPTA